mmetsp:Transcript_13514/g.31420  ORF Transcript_13514/g.31420 Transcript_13514/m.31420 type:complete len:89 (-) Transcript_13514:449-715(-)
MHVLSSLEWKIEDTYSNLAHTISDLPRGQQAHDASGILFAEAIERYPQHIHRIRQPTKLNASTGQSNHQPLAYSVTSRLYRLLPTETP